jgi:phosphoglycolate phosphatase
MNYAYDALGFERLPRDVMRTLIGPPLHLELPKLLGETRAHQTPEVMRLYREHHGKSGIYQYRFYDGMEEALRSLTARHRLFVATSKPKVYADEILRHFGKLDLFEFIYGSELSGVNSKKGDLIRYAMNEQNLAAQETTMIGDRKHDLIGAQENGIRSIGVTWGYGSREELVSSRADHIVASWDELTRII